MRTLSRNGVCLPIGKPANRYGKDREQYDKLFEPFGFLSFTGIKIRGFRFTQTCAHHQSHTSVECAADRWPHHGQASNVATHSHSNIGFASHVEPLRNTPERLTGVRRFA
jgi:hypothetical protein